MASEMIYIPPEVILAIGHHLHDQDRLATLAVLASTNQDNHQLLLPLLYRSVDILSDKMLSRFILAHFRLSASSPSLPIKSTEESLNTIQARPYPAAATPSDKASKSQIFSRTKSMADDKEDTQPFSGSSERTPSTHPVEEPSSPHSHPFALTLVHKLKLHETLSPSTSALILSLPSHVFPNATYLSISKSVIYSLKCRAGLIHLLPVRTLCLRRDPPRGLVVASGPTVDKYPPLWFYRLAKYWAGLEVVYWHFRPAIPVIRVKNYAAERTVGMEQEWSNEDWATTCACVLRMDGGYALWPDHLLPSARSEDIKTKVVLCGKANQALAISTKAKMSSSFRRDVEDPFWRPAWPSDRAFDSDGILRILEFTSNACCTSKDVRVHLIRELETARQISSIEPFSEDVMMQVPYCTCNKGSYDLIRASNGVTKPERSYEQGGPFFQVGTA
ncbi:hypothetical protein TREMEDRAFT_62301 [Tremella mesenterica DSM 1558]|uniref:uncharacterized protein n=1 Tax=Tremella mesenterica (strain ATCC 24925 / CBS 8224 / DSM 1558 / NBRC 9311 / NRRL Y-6157 / RJB 2259-6 / UBC 559-6) TaxID=578456 RepID=UPI0003F4A464|nr:uncharacterized protein TREMEDRAFT_62301 [Tremella mesenterica DSM 1558]EIW69433.1 hypothetical protein TREMEDRAFT_62301 [Tremella mesenterica DSM 1558]